MKEGSQSLYPETIRTVAILGAGSGGCAAAADLTLRGYTVQLQARREERLQPLRERGGIEVTGSVHEGFVPLSHLTTSVAEAVEGADLIMLVVPALAHRYYAEQLAPLLSPERLLFLNPGHTGGGLHFVHELRRAGYTQEVQTCETLTLTYACRLQGPSRVLLATVFRNLRWAAFPGKNAPHLYQLLKPLYPEIVQAPNVLEIGLNNVNAVVHPLGMLMNAGWIEHTTGDFFFYREGLSEAVSRVILAVDAERQQIARALNVSAWSCFEIIRQVGLFSEAAVTRGDLAQAWKECLPVQMFKAPPALNHRFLHEDVGCGLVPFAALGRVAGVPTPTIDAVIHLASLATGIAYRETGLGLDAMGLTDVAAADLQQFLHTGAK
jgi:opine dehydrogenase